MIYLLKSGADKEQIAEINKRLLKGNDQGFNAKKYNGSLKITGDAVSIQKGFRREWERSIKL